MICTHYTDRLAEKNLEGAHRSAIKSEENVMKSLRTNPIQDIHADTVMLSETNARRGSALLIVIGTLALISVFAVVYIAIGRTDRRAANTVREFKNQKESSTDFSQYIANIIGIDRLDVIPYQGNATSSNVFGRLELIDFPYTDYTRLSETGNGNRAYAFTPQGGVFAEGGDQPVRDYRVASDPWLASTTPTYLGNPGITNNDRPFSNYDEFYDPIYPNAKNFMDNRDWAQISNFAPDGRFVNLFNLRSNRASGFSVGAVGVTGSEFGSFNAEPGVGVMIDNDGRRIRRMSNYLSLLDKDIPSDPESLITAFDPSASGEVWVPGQNVPLNIGISGDDIFNTPAVWTMNQRFMLMPLNQPFVTLNRRGEISTWADPDYPAYQYADADGDGMADSRWIELLAARDRNEGDGSDPREDIESFYERSDIRYFLGIRAVDLSSMVNVNTATDSLVPPTIEFPLGATPADVDLRRLLTMQDAASNYTAYNNNQPLSPALYHRPFRENDEPLNGPRDPANATGWELRNLDRNVADYWNYNTEFLDGSAQPKDPRELANDSNAYLIGRYAYDALRLGLVQGSSLSNEYVGFNPSFGSVATAQTLVQFERDHDPANVGMLVQTQISPEQRYEQYLNIGRLDPTRLASSWSRGDYNATLYGLDDLTELLTYHGLNDPDVTSRLERVVDGRHESPFGDTLQTRRLGPLGSNRPLSLDRNQHGNTMIDVTRDPAVAPSAEDIQFRGVTGRMSFNSMAMKALSPRSFLTTLSGSVALRNNTRIDEPWNRQELTGSSAAPIINTTLSDTNLLFDVYSTALAGEIDSPDSYITNTAYWPDNVEDFDRHQASTLFYGHRGPELALRIAAHSAVNMKDLVDGDTDPTIATLVLDSTESADLDTRLMNDLDPTDEFSLFYPGYAQGNVLDAQSDLPTESYLSNNLPDSRKLVNVYGIEPMPIITEVSVLHAYTDSTEALGGDQDSSEPPTSRGGMILWPAGEGLDDVMEVTLSGGVGTAATNPDFLIQVVAFQLHNPFDQAISLGGSTETASILDRDPLTRHREPNNDDRIDTNANYQFEYYIEYAGRFFKLAEYLEYYPEQGNSDYFDIDTRDVAFGTVPNPTDTISAMTGGRLEAGTRDSATAPGGQATYSDFITRNVVLNPGETRVFYAIADRRFDDLAASRDARWESQLAGALPDSFTNADFDQDGDGLFDGVDGRDWTGPAEEWVRHQFTVASGSTQTFPMMISEFDPINGELVNETSASVEDLTIAPATSVLSSPDASRLDATEVRLWKKITSEGEETTDTSIANVVNPTSDNLLMNDLLVDRMDLGGPLTDGFSGGPIANTFSFTDPDFPQPEDGMVFDDWRNENTGLTIARWKTVRRLDSETENLPGVGQVTPWMLRSRSTPSNTRVIHENPVLANDVVTDLFDGSNFDMIDGNVTIKGDYEIQPSMESFFNLSFVVGARAIVQTVALPPHRKSDVTAGPTPFGEDDAANGSLGKFPPDQFIGSLPTVHLGLNPNNGPVPELLTSGSNISEKPRLADLLLAWGIGPTYAPDPTRDISSFAYEEGEWMTVTEALAIALGVDDPVPAPTPATADMVWNGTNLYNGTDDNVLDHGHLALDNYVSYMNLGLADPPVFEAGVDIPRGTGAPMALGVIDQVRALAPLSQVHDPFTAVPTLEELLNRATFGKININTAPIEVLRLLPGLTPSRAQYVGGATMNEWWGKDLTDTNLPTLDVATSLDTLNENPDVASAIVAYRDRTYGQPQTASHPDAAAVTSPYYLTPMNLEPLDPDIYGSNNANNLRLEQIPIGDTVPIGDVSLSREAMTGIDGLRQTPGFGSLGELLAVRINPEFETGTSAERWNNIRHLSIDQYGFDEEASGKQDETTILGQLFGGTEPGTTIDDYGEKLSMANSVLNMISVRSDYYAVWFVVHGYRESDVVNLRDEDPLVPSVQKRFLMVIDRTDVIKPGDKPKILVLKEVPM
jgi:hypothetical protein